MSSIFSQLKGFNRDTLKSVETRITTADGKKFVEGQRDEAGVRSVEEQGNRGLGFCPDLQPDLSVGVAQERLLVGSQDVAHHLGTLRHLGVTHVLNVAWGVPNAFPDDFTYLTVPMYDEPSELLTSHYSRCRQFIKQAHSDGGTVLVHWFFYSAIATMSTAAHWSLQ
ncbi:Dual specificity protein phosphatase 19 [Geodia barretti]|uniref:Dual specificity protein phosphatase 19 n=2 Tax=Geodia barretti TaxID=519541 RepID=A0AA35R259_GEOBA|nr:Dual specificity protein phosphatase 19 [Geodia barretti]